jgi:hypothetical protein
VGRRFRALLPAAAGGLVAGHFLTYVVLSPAGPNRAALLRHTGHGYYPRAVTAAAALTAIAMGAAAARGAVRRNLNDGSPIDRLALPIKFAIVQAIGFVLLEVVERAVAGAPLGGLVDVLPVGFVIESVLAALVVWILTLTERASTTIARSIVGRRPARRVAPRSLARAIESETAAPVLRLLASSVTLRGPPLTWAS